MRILPLPFSKPICSSYAKVDLMFIHFKLGNKVKNTSLNAKVRILKAKT